MKPAKPTKKETEVDSLTLRMMTLFHEKKEVEWYAERCASALRLHKEKPWGTMTMNVDGEFRAPHEVTKDKKKADCDAAEEALQEATTKLEDAIDKAEKAAEELGDQKRIHTICYFAHWFGSDDDYWRAKETTEE